MTDVNVAVGVRWSVVQDVERPALARAAQLGVKVHVLPALQKPRLTLGEVGTHGKFGAREIQCIFVICHNGLTSQPPRFRPKARRQSSVVPMAERARRKSALSGAQTSGWRAANLCCSRDVLSTVERGFLGVVVPEKCARVFEIRKHAIFQLFQ